MADKLRHWEFWVMDVVPKSYKQRLTPSKDKKVNPDGEVVPARWLPGKPYLSPASRDFELMVRACAAEAGVVPIEHVKILIKVYWPVMSKGKRIVYPKRDNVDLSNVQKSVEDALQKRRVPPSLYSRRKECNEKLAESEYNPCIKREYWVAELRKVEDNIEQWQDGEAMYGAVMTNDVQTCDIRTVRVWLPPDAQKCVKVEIWEVDPQSYWTERLKVWFASAGDSTSKRLQRIVGLSKGEQNGANNV